MFSTLRLVSSLLLGVAFLMVGVGGLSTILAFRMGEAGLPSTVVGVVTAMYFVGLVLGTGFCHRLITNVGHIRAFAALGSLMSAATLAHALTLDPWLWGTLRFIVGFTTVGMYMCTESWLNEKSSNEIRGQVFSLYQVVLYLAQGVGQFLINIPDQHGMVLYILTSILMSLAIMPVAMTRVSAPELPKPVRFRLGRLWNISPTGMTGSLAAGTAMGAFYGLGALFAQQAGLETHQTAQFMGAVILGGLLLQWPIGKLSDMIDRRLVIIGVSIATAAVCVAIMDKNVHNGSGLLALGALFGGLSFTLYPLAVAYMNDYVEADDLVPASGGLMMAYGIGAALGPVVGAMLMDAVGARGLFLFIGAVVILLAIFIAWRITQRRSLPVEEQGDYQTIQRTSPIVYEMYPESGGDDVDEDPEDDTRC
ncbi:MAG: MFS transporter [Rhodospirillales bacterium]|nr:MFS transporter [Rhodospirillales bacterium]MBO6787974.1 MFS transporter [Rhodospirillales bacterium]